MKTVIVLGTARSGTSMVSGFLHHIGVDMNPDYNPSIQNPKGSFEDPTFINITTRMFLDYKKGDVNLTSKYRFEIQKIIRSRAKRSDLWGWKSALTHYVLGHFLLHVKNPHLVFVFRDPLYNVKSDMFHKKVNYGYKISFQESLKNVADSLTQLAKVADQYKNLPQFYTSFNDCREKPIEVVRDLCSFLDVNFSGEIKEKIEDFIVPNYHSYKADQ